MKPMIQIALAAAMAAAAPAGEATPDAAWERGWPSMLGPRGNGTAVQTGRALVDDLARARLLWESDETDFGRAKHTTGTFKRPGRVAAVLGPGAAVHPGGWAAPVIAGGRLFATSFRPAGRVYDVRTLFDTTEKACLEAEDLLIALDARTGKLLWKAAEPGGFVWGVGKRRGFQFAPACHGGRVFGMGTTGRLFAYAADDGMKLWSTPPDPRMIEKRDAFLADPGVRQAAANFGWQQSLVVAGGVLVVPRGDRLIGRDVKTGAVRWELAGVISPRATPNPWRHGGREYLLCATAAAPGRAALRLIDPADGRVRWTVWGLHANHATLSPSGTHVMVNVGSAIVKTDANNSAPRDTEGKAFYGLPGAYRIAPGGAEPAWRFPDEPRYVHSTWLDTAARRRILIRDGLVYYAATGPDREKHRRLVVAREEDGTILADVPRDNDSWFQVIENRLLHAIDWSHGRRARFDLYAADPRDFRRLAGPWQPGLPLTTAYTVYMEPPVVAGRIFLRTERGTVACYDLGKE